MNDKPDLEKIMKIIIKQIDSSEKPLVELYFNNPDALSPEYREKAAGMIKQFLSKFPDFAGNFKEQITDTKKPEELSELRTAVSRAKGRLERVESAYRVWGDRISETGEVYHECCQLTMGEYMGAIEGEMAQISTSLTKAESIEIDLEGKADIKSLKEQATALEEDAKTYEEEHRRLKDNYNRNRFDPATNQWHGLKKLFSMKSTSGFMKHIGPYDEPVEK